MKERPEEIQLILDNLGKQLTELRESVGVKRSYIYRNGNLPAGSVISIESAARDSRINSLFEYLKMVGGYILLKSRDENVDSIKIESIDDVKKAFDQILYDKRVTHNWLHDKTGVEIGMISGAITGSKGSKVGVLLFCASVLGFDFFMCKKDGFAPTNETVRLKKTKEQKTSNTFIERVANVMTRSEFVHVLKKCRESAKCGNKEFCLKTMLAIDYSGLKKIESSCINFKIDRVLIYLEAIGFCIKVFYNTDIFIIKSNKQLSEIFKRLRIEHRLTQMELASLTNMSHTAVRNAEYGETKIPIDVFLKYMQIFGYTIEIKKIE